jgi:broad-specificity NMP kinase
MSAKDADIRITIQGTPGAGKSIIAARIRHLLEFDAGGRMPVFVISDTDTVRGAYADEVHGRYRQLVESRARATGGKVVIEIVEKCTYHNLKIQKDQ